jgi:ADP-ribose pyrophosphatase YjhB (NUDIX family)
VFVGDDVVRAAESEFGSPREVAVTQEILPWEMDLIERVCGNTRYHDVTIVVVRDGHMALVHKPSEPSGAFWAPTGGLTPGERLPDGVRREAWEETGMEVEPIRYLLRMRTLFTCGPRSRRWISHVFLADHVSGNPAPVDTDEIETAEWVSFARFREEVAPILLDSGWGRFRYRLEISRCVYEELGLAPLQLPEVSPKLVGSGGA